MIRLQFTNEPNPAQALIAYMSHGPVSHVDAVLPDGRLLGARPIGGVMIRPRDYDVFSYVAVASVPCIEPIRAAFYDWLHQQIGQPYGFAVVAGYIADRNWRTPGTQTCSEMMVTGLEAVGFFKRPLFAPANKVSPEELALVLSAMGAVFKIETRASPPTPDNQGVW